MILALVFTSYIKEWVGKLEDKEVVQNDNS